MKEALSIIKVEAIKSNDEESASNVDKFTFLLQTQWSYDINAPTLRSLKENKPKINVMPVTEDLMNLSKCIESEILKGRNQLEEAQNLNTWLSVATTVLAGLIIFNRQREGEVSQIKLKTYIERPNYSKAETDMLKSSMAPSEYILHEKYHHTSTRGKKEVDKFQLFF